LETCYTKMQRNGSSDGTAHHVHRTIRNALNEGPYGTGILRGTRYCRQRRLS
jgi:hypothetical protein